MAVPEKYLRVGSGESVQSVREVGLKGRRVRSSDSCQPPSIEKVP